MPQRLVRKTRTVWLANGENSSIICLAVLRRYRRVTDRRTDRQTDVLRQHGPRYVYTTCGEN